MFGAKIENNPSLSKQKPITSLAKMKKTTFVYLYIEDLLYLCKVLNV